MKEGTFLVTAVDEESAILRDVSDGQVHTLEAQPDLEAHLDREGAQALAEGQVLQGTLEAAPPMEVVWSVAEVARVYEVSVAESAEPPTQRARETAAAQDAGAVTRHERAGTGEVHVLTVPDDRTEAAVADVLDDETTVERAARLGVERVEVRSEPGVVSVRYLP